MTTIKSYTDLEQSKKLVEILPLESADMGWNVFVDDTTRILPIDDWNLVKDGRGNVKFYNAWSLAALLSVLDFPSLTQNKEDEWEVCVPNHQSDGYIEALASNPIDACVAMIEKLHELKML